MELLRLDRAVPTDPSPGLERHEPGSGWRSRRRVERRDPEEPDEEAEEEDSGDETEKHTFDTRA